MPSNSTAISTIPTTMTSREIAELTGKSHTNVLRDIRVLLTQLYGLNDDSNLSHQEIQGVTFEVDNRNYIAVANLDKDHTLTLVSGYDAVLRMRIIKRWQELEAQAAAPKLPDFTKPAEAARAWATEYERAETERLEKEAALKQIAQDAPKVQFHDEVAQAEGEATVSETCCILFGQSVKEKDFRQWLKQNHWLDARPRLNKPTAWAVKLGYMSLRIDPVNGMSFVTPVITSRGLTILRHLYRTGDLFSQAVEPSRLLAAPSLPT